MTSKAPLLWLPAALFAGVALGLTFPLPVAIPLPGLLAIQSIVVFLLALSMPLLSVGRAVWQRRVWGALLAINLLAVPGLAFILSRLVFHTYEMQVGVLLVLLAPGVALSLPIIRGAGGDAESVLGVMPILLAGLLVLVPLLTIVLSGGVFALADIPPTLIPIALTIVFPVGVALLLQAVTKNRGHKVATVFGEVPRWTIWAGAVGFFLVAWDRTPGVAERLPELSWLVPISIAFLVLMAPLNLLVAGLAGVTVDKRRAILIAGIGRGGLVMLPITLSLDSEVWGLVPFVVMLYTSIEAMGLLVYRSITPEILDSSQR
jgi:predicted Na+-dependent transporter